MFICIKNPKKTILKINPHFFLAFVLFLHFSIIKIFPTCILLLCKHELINSIINELFDSLIGPKQIVLEINCFKQLICYYKCCYIDPCYIVKTPCLYYNSKNKNISTFFEEKAKLT